MTAQGMWDDDQESVLVEEAQGWVDAQVKILEEMPPQAPEEIFRSMYAEMPPHVAEQMQSLIDEVRS
jgi:TPP-dependent pyruvate/acetoin dehydrogenase alpha subunit